MHWISRISKSDLLKNIFEMFSRLTRGQLRSSMETVIISSLLFLIFINASSSIDVVKSLSYDTSKSFNQDGVESWKNISDRLTENKNHKNSHMNLFHDLMDFKSKAMEKFKEQQQSLDKIPFDRRNGFHDESVSDNFYRVANNSSRPTNNQSRVKSSTTSTTTTTTTRRNFKTPLNENLSKLNTMKKNINTKPQKPAREGLLGPGKLRKAFNSKRQSTNKLVGNLKKQVSILMAGLGNGATPGAGKIKQQAPKQAFTDLFRSPDELSRSLDHDYDHDDTFADARSIADDSETTITTKNPSMREPLMKRGDQHNKQTTNIELELKQHNSSASDKKKSSETSISEISRQHHEVLTKGDKVTKELLSPDQKDQLGSGQLVTSSINTNVEVVGKHGDVLIREKREMMNIYNGAPSPGEISSSPSSSATLNEVCSRSELSAGAKTACEQLEEDVRNELTVSSSFPATSEKIESSCSKINSLLARCWPRQLALLRSASNSMMVRDDTFLAQYMNNSLAQDNWPLADNNNQDHHDTSSELLSLDLEAMLYESSQQHKDNNSNNNVNNKPSPPSYKQLLVCGLEPKIPKFMVDRVHWMWLNLCIDERFRLEYLNNLECLSHWTEERAQATCRKEHDWMKSNLVRDDQQTSNNNNDGGESQQNNNNNLSITSNNRNNNKKTSTNNQVLNNISSEDLVLMPKMLCCIWDLFLRCVYKHASAECGLSGGQFIVTYLTRIGLDDFVYVCNNGASSNRTGSGSTSDISKQHKKKNNNNNNNNNDQLQAIQQQWQANQTRSKLTASNQTTIPAKSPFLETNYCDELRVRKALLRQIMRSQGNSIDGGLVNPRSSTFNTRRNGTQINTTNNLDDINGGKTTGRGNESLIDDRNRDRLNAHLDSYLQYNEFKFPNSEPNSHASTKMMAPEPSLEFVFLIPWLFALLFNGFLLSRIADPNHLFRL